MSVNIKVKYLVLFVFIFGCATGPAIQKYLSFQDAVAKTGSKCHYTRTTFSAIDGFNAHYDDILKAKIRYNKVGKVLVGSGWKFKAYYGNSSEPGILWEKCSR